MSHHLSNPEVKPPTKVDSGPIDHEPWDGFIEEGITVEEVEDYVSLARRRLQTTTNSGNQIHEIDPPSINLPYAFPEDELQTCVPKKQENIFDDPCYLSFGDKGTTATMTCWGQHVQISRYLGYGQSGVVCMDHGETYEPYLRNYRRQSLVESIKYGAGFGCDILLPGTGEYSYKVSWIHNKWPQILFRGKGWKIVQQSFIKNGVVIQDILLHNESKEELEAELKVNFDILTRQLEFENSSNKFNEDFKSVERKSTNNTETGGEVAGESNHEGKSGVDADYTHGAGPAGYGFVQIHRTPSKINLGGCEEGGVKSDEPQKTTPDAHERENVETGGAHPDAVASVWGFFINGKAKKMEFFERENPFKVNPEQTFRFITGYKLVLLSTKSPSWKLLTISAADVDMEDFLHDSAPKEKDASNVDPDSTPKEKEASKIDPDPTPQGRDAGNLDPGSLECKFSMSRIIEHILGVCAIPITPSYVWEKGLSVKSESHSDTEKYDGQEIEPIALTQGEMAFHRVSTRESL